VRADEKLTAFVELERAINEFAVDLISQITLPLRCSERKASVFPANNFVDSVPASVAVSRRAKSVGRLPQRAPPDPLSAGLTVTEGSFTQKIKRNP
jgi:hypothetical protein